MAYKKICMKCGKELKEEENICPRCKKKYNYNEY